MSVFGTKFVYYPHMAVYESRIICDKAASVVVKSGYPYSVPEKLVYYCY